MTVAIRRQALQAACRCTLVCFATGWLTCSSPATAAKRSVRAWSGPTENVVALGDAASPALALGSGVMLPGGKVLTDCHLFDDVERLEVRARKRRSEASVVYADRKRDLCELKVAQPGRFHPAALRQRDTHDLDPGESVYAVAASNGEAKVVMGRVVRVLREGEDEIVLISSRLTPEYSGGALFDRSGAFIGVLTHRERSSSKLSYAYPARYILMRSEAEAARVQRTAGASQFKTVAEEYLNRLAEASREGLKYPEEARSQAWSGTASIRFDLDPGGELLQSFVDVSSGYAGLDVSALLAVRRAIEEVPMPPAVKERGLKGTVSITFAPSVAAEARE